MAAQYLWKKGERSLGPFSLDEMRKLIRGGSLGRFQQVSTDGGASWAQAGTFAELWESKEMVPVPPPVPPAPPPLPPPPTVATVPSVIDAVRGLSTEGAGGPRPVRGGWGLGLAGFISAIVGLVLTVVPLLIWVLRYSDGYWAVPLVYPLLVASVTGLILSCIAMSRRAGGFATSGLVVGICGSALGLVTAIGWLVSQDPRDEWGNRLTAGAEADVEIANRNFNSALKRYREHAPSDDHVEALARVTKDLMLLTQAYKNLLQAAASTPRFRQHFVKTEALSTAFIKFSEAVKLRDKIDALEAINKIGQKPGTLKELLDLWDLYRTGQLSIEAVQAKFRDS